MPLLFLLTLFTFFIVITVMFLSIFRFDKAIVAAVNFWARFSFPLVGKKLNFVGKEKIVKNHKYILVANHGSLFDIMAIMAICPNVSWLGKASLMKVPLFSNSLKAINYVPLNNSDLRNTKGMINSLIKNAGAQTIGIFPEGTRTKTGELSKFKKGFVHVFRATELDILPVTLNGFFKLKPKGRPYLDFRVKLNVFIHDVIKKEVLIDKTNEDIIETVKSVLVSVYEK